MSKNAKPALDWFAIERQYRAGTPSVRAIADQHGITEAAIRKRAKRDGWERDLSQQVKAQVRTALVRAGSQSPSEDDLRTEQEIVQEAVATVVEVVRQHRAGARRGAAIVEQLFTELEVTTANVDEIEADILEATVGDSNSTRRQNMLKAVALPSRANIVDKLASALQKFTAVEREAWGLNAKERDDDLANMTEEQLKARIAAIEVKLKDG